MRGQEAHLEGVEAEVANLVVEVVEGPPFGCGDGYLMRTIFSYQTLLVGIDNHVANPSHRRQDARLVQEVDSVGVPEYALWPAQVAMMKRSVISRLEAFSSKSPDPHES